MKLIFMMLSFIGLALTIVPAFFVFAEIIPFQLHLTLMSIGTLVWFITAPLWMKKQDEV